MTKICMCTYRYNTQDEQKTVIEKMAILAIRGIHILTQRRTTFFFPDKFSVYKYFLFVASIHCLDTRSTN